MIVKICGITDVEETEYLNENNVDMAGMVLYFPKSKRNITLEKAKEIMEDNPDLFIKAIAAMVGFSDQFYFSRIFHSITGMSPAEYMKNHKGISCDAKS